MGRLRFIPIVLFTLVAAIFPEDVTAQKYEVLTPNQGVMIKSNDVVQLRCGVDPANRRGLQDIVWSMDDIKLDEYHYRFSTEHSYYIVRYAATASTLHIKMNVDTNGKTFYCHGKLEDGSSVPLGQQTLLEDDPVDRSVPEKPYILPVPKRAVVPEHTYFQLDCAVNLLDENHITEYIKWQYLDPSNEWRTINEDSRRRIHTNQKMCFDRTVYNNELIISNVTQADAGQYRCLIEVVNDGTVSDFEREMYLVVNDYAKCHNESCGDNSVCAFMIDGSANCTCGLGYHGNPSACRPLCKGKRSECPHRDICRGRCGINATCSINGNQAECFCPPGFEGNANRECRPTGGIDVCQDVHCPDNSRCYPGEDVGHCLCDPNFSGSPPKCKPKCFSTNECRDDERCTANECINPCEDNPCGLNTKCTVVNHSRRCECLPGYEGDPYSNCGASAVPPDAGKLGTPEGTNFCTELLYALCELITGIFA